jgi:hypothetical protein
MVTDNAIKELDDFQRRALSHNNHMDASDRLYLVKLVTHLFLMINELERRIDQLEGEKK